MPSEAMTTHAEAVLRIVLAMVAGMVIGLERESHGRAAGLRTTVLVCVAAAMAMLLSEDLQVFSSASGWRPDPARLGAGVLTGMGFLGAGSIIRQENMVRGVTTAATLWCVTVIGLALGSGCYLLGGLGWVAALIALFALPHLESWVKNDWYATVTVDVAIDGPSEEELRRILKGIGVKVKSMDLEYNMEHKKKIIRYDLKFKKVNLVETSRMVVHQMVQQPGVNDVKWK